MTHPLPSENDARFERKLQALREQIERLSNEHISLRSAAKEAGELLEELESHRTELLDLNRRLAQVSADSAELLAELEEKNRALESANEKLSSANAYAAELIGDIETKNAKIDSLNKALSKANASASELVAELEIHREDLEKTNAALAKTNGEKSRLLGVVAHDLRSGIGGIGSLADLLADVIASSPSGAAEDHARLIKEESHRLLDMLAGLLDMSRIDQGRLDLKREHIDLNDIASESIDFHQRFADQKSQTLIFLRSAEPLAVRADPTRIRQVCDNLLSNAIKYSPSGGLIEVLMERDPSGRPVVRVRDEGQGITDDDKKKMFQAFQTLSARPTGGEDSQGLGLAIAHKMVELHDGAMWADNRSDRQGAEFCFSLPDDSASRG